MTTYSAAAVALRASIARESKKEEEEEEKRSSWHRFL